MHEAPIERRPPFADAHRRAARYGAQLRALPTVPARRRKCFVCAAKSSRAKAVATTIALNVATARLAILYQFKGRVLSPWENECSVERT